MWLQHPKSKRIASTLASQADGLTLEARKMDTCEISVVLDAPRKDVAYKFFRDLIYISQTQTSPIVVQKQAKCIVA